MTAEAAHLIAAIREFWSTAGAGRPDHDHRRGGENCPRCSTADAFVAGHLPEIQGIVRDELAAQRAARGRR